MARKLFFQTKMYDYSSKACAEADIIEMKKNGWAVKDQYEQKTPCVAGYTYTVEYMKQH